MDTLAVENAMTRRPRGDSARRMQEIITAVRGDLTYSWSVRQMADLIGIKESQLRRICSDAFRKSPRELLKDVRYEAAADMLRNPNVRIKEVVARVGLADGSHFCRDFRLRYGASPIDYQLHCSSQHSE